MAAPAFVAKGTKATGTGNSITPTYMGSIAANEIIWLLVCSVGNGTISVSGSGWIECMVGTILSPPTAAVKLYYRSANGTESGTVTVSRSGHWGSSLFMAQMYQYSGTAYLTLESNPVYPTYGGSSSTITVNALTVGGSERTLCAFVINYNGLDPGTPTGYTNSATDNDGAGTYFECHTLANVSSDGSVTATNGSSNGWMTVHASLYNAPAPAVGSRSFIVN